MEKEQRELNRIAACYYRACLADIGAIKPGNVSVHSAGHGMQADDFRRSAVATAQVLNRELPCAAGELGKSILLGAEATMNAVGCNTNLGILLLCFPLAHAAASCDTDNRISNCLEQVLQVADITDTQMIFDAVRIMQPAGLGRSSQHDVNLPASANLLTVMQASAGKDRIAWQYGHNFSDVLGFGMNSLFSSYGDSPTRFDEPGKLSSVTSDVFMDFLAEIPDTHIARKHGATMAEAVRDEARKRRNEINIIDQPVDKQKLLEEFDEELKLKGINPGTSADLTVAVIYAAQLELLCSERHLQPDG